MWVVVHLYAGLAVGALLHLPFWALALIVVASHVPMDLIPHWDYTRARRHRLWGVLDFLAGLLTLVVGFVAFGAPLRLLALGVLAAAPDFDVLFETLRSHDARFWFPSHWQRFPHGECGPLPGVAVQAAIVGLCGVALALS